VLHRILDLLYPRTCPVCSSILGHGEQKICRECIGKLVYVTQPSCMKCGKPLEKEEKEYCCDCKKKEYHYERGYALWVYNQYARKSMVAFKYKHQKEYADFYVEEFLNQYEQQIQRWKADAMIPVPIHISKLRERGYNQAEVLAAKLGIQLGIPVQCNLLRRVKKTMPQKELDDRQRLRNLLEAFSVDIKYQNALPETVILVDDIYTTGSTIEACSLVLKQAGVKKIYFISICIGRGI